MNLEILYSKSCEDSINSVSRILEEVYGIKTIETLSKEPIKETFNPDRNQYNASILLDQLIDNNGAGSALWILDKDIYSEGTNFIFGLASPGQGAVLSVYRLNSLELVLKESIHEMGHLLGLAHCRNSCVMQFSNSLAEAKRKPSQLCEKCKKLIISDSAEH